MRSVVFVFIFLAGVTLAPAAAFRGYNVTRVNSTSFEASRVVTGNAAQLLSIFGYNSGAAGFVQIFDSAALPADGAAPAISFGVPAAGNFSLDVATIGIPFGNGITVCISSTADTKTIAGPSLYLTAVIK